MELPSPDLAIRARRAVFNRALAAADLNAIAPILTQNAVLVTGSDSAVLSGRKAQLLAWKREFAAADRVVYSRIPDRIEASAVEPVALEYGHWQGVRANGNALASGTYAAKWRKRGADWLLEAEIFVTLA